MTRLDRSRLDAAIAAACADPALLAAMDTMLERIGRSEELAWNWSQGGCLVLAEALRRVAGGSLIGVFDETVSDEEWRSDEIDAESLDHVIVELAPDLYADANGTASFDQLFDRVERSGNFLSPTLLPLDGINDPRLAAVLIAYDEKLVVALADRLRAELA